MNDHLANDIGIDDIILDEINEWMYDNNYDTDAIIEDIKIARLKGDDQSNIHQYCRLKNQIKCYNNIKAFVTKHGRMFNKYIFIFLYILYVAVYIYLAGLVTKPRSGSGEEEKEKQKKTEQEKKEEKEKEIKKQNRTHSRDPCMFLSYFILFYYK